MTRATYTGPAHPIGYVETQVSWVGDVPVEEYQALIDEAVAKTLRENPGLVKHGLRFEIVFDGAGVGHRHAYIGFAPAHVAAEPLDPHNMNDAPMPEPGWPEPTDGIVPLGTKEQKF